MTTKKTPPTQTQPTEGNGDKTNPADLKELIANANGIAAGEGGLVGNAEPEGGAAADGGPAASGEFIVNDMVQVLCVVGPEKGRRRAGRRFDQTPVYIPLADLSEQEISDLQADRSLITSIGYQPATDQT